MERGARQWRRTDHSLRNVEAKDCHTVGPESAGIAGAVHYYTDGPAGASRMMRSAGTRLE